MVTTIPAPGGGGDPAWWAEGTLWVGQYRDRKIHQIDPQIGTILRTIESNRFVTGVTWVDGELWHGTWEGDESELRRIDPQNGEVLNELEMPPPEHTCRDLNPTAAIGSLRRRRHRQGESRPPPARTRARAAPTRGNFAEVLREDDGR